MASTTFSYPPLDDSSAAPITSGTTDTSVRLSHSSSPRRLIESTSAVAKMIGSAVGLPGVFEADVQQTPNQHHAEVAGLGAHLQGMLLIVDTDNSLLERQRIDLSRHLESARRQVDEMQRSNRPLSSARARDQLEELEGLSKQTDRLAVRQILMHLKMHDLATQARHVDMSSKLESIVKATSQKQKSLVSSVRAPAPEPHDFPEDKVLAIDLDSIECQKVELSYIAIEQQPCSESCSHMCALTHSDGIVRVTCTTGLLNGVRVMRKSYNSPDQAVATQLAKRDIVLLSKYSHPNLASLKGVARDMHGRIREIVTTTAPMTQREFLERVADPQAIARYAKGMLELRELDNMNRRSPVQWIRDVAQIGVNYNGHVTANPAMYKIGKSWDWFQPRNAKLSSTAKDVLKIFYDQVEIYYNLPYDPSGLHRFIDGVSHLQPGFTPLDVLKVAVSAESTPCVSIRTFSTYGPPSATFSAGDFVIIENERCVGVPEKRSRQVRYAHGPQSPSIDASSCTKGWRSSLIPPSALFATWYEGIEIEPWK
ncbi:hypothetical protein FRC12_007958, partial [Ceratobasidium sp. 428]